MNTKRVSQYVPGQVGPYGQVLTGGHSVSKRAIMGRLNRVMESEEWAIRKCRKDSRFYLALGDYYCIDLHTKKVACTQIDLDEFARDWFALASNEMIAE